MKEMMEAEMDDQLGYEKSERSDNDDYLFSILMPSTIPCVNGIIRKLAAYVIPGINVEGKRGTYHTGRR